MRAPLVLTIAPTETDGAAGLQADLRALAALGVRGVSAATMVVTATEERLHDMHPLPAEVIGGQVAALAGELRLDATKIGALGGLTGVQAVTEAVRTHRDRLGPIVLDPVMLSGHGTAMITAEGARALAEQLLPLADVLTPTLAEAAQLLGQPLATSIEEVREQALALQARGPRTVLVTGRMLEGEDVVDVLVHEGGTDLLRARRVERGRLRGAGSALSAAIAAQLARIAGFARAGELGEIGEAGADDDMVTIVASARELVATATEALREGQSVLELPAAVRLS